MFLAAADHARSNVERSGTMGSVPNWPERTFTVGVDILTFNVEHSVIKLVLFLDHYGDTTSVGQQDVNAGAVVLCFEAEAVLAMVFVFEMDLTDVRPDIDRLGRARFTFVDGDGCG
jgi:hypothetical protein